MENIKVKALGRYNTIRSYAKKTGLQLVSLRELIGQTGVYNTKTVIKKLEEKFPGSEIDLLNENNSRNGGWCWYKGWCCV